MQTIKQFSSWFSKQKLFAKLAIGVSSGILLCCLCSIPIAILSPSTPTPAINNTSVANVESTKPIDVATDVATLAPTDTPVPTSTPLPTETPNPNLVAPGTYLVNVDIQPSIYKGGAGAGLFSSCYWERLKDLTGSFDAILANDNSVGQFYVEVKNSDYALKTDCELVRLDPIPEHTGEYPQVITTGTYLVGYDIQPGTYKGQAGSDAGSSCYWERLQSVAGGFDAILANDNATGQFYVQVLPSDFALKTGCELNWVSP
jgi:hypothetical protein